MGGSGSGVLEKLEKHTLYEANSDKKQGITNELSYLLRLIFEFLESLLSWDKKLILALDGQL